MSSSSWRRSDAVDGPADPDGVVQDRSQLGDASRVLGAGEWKTLWRITIPLSLPGVIAGCISPIPPALPLRDTDADRRRTARVHAAAHLQQAVGANNWPFAAAISVVFMVVVLVIVGFLGVLGTKGARPMHAPRRQIDWEGLFLRVAFGAITIVAMVFLVAPTVVVLVTSLTASESLRFPPPRFFAALVHGPARCGSDAARGLEQPGDRVLDHDLIRAAGRRASIAIAHGRSRWIKLADLLFMSPLLLPALAFGFAALVFVNRMGFSPNIPILNLGHVIVCVPFIFAPPLRRCRRSTRR